MLDFEHAAAFIDNFYERKLKTEDSVGRAIDLCGRRIRELHSTGQISFDTRQKLVDRYRLINKGRKGYYQGSASTPVAPASPTPTHSARLVPPTNTPVPKQKSISYVKK